jgi:cyclase
MTIREIIPCLDCDLSVPDGRVVKGVKFEQIKYAGIPWELAKRYCEEGADELVLLDITATTEKRETMLNVVEKTASVVTVPFTVGGGIKSLEDMGNVLKAGADRVGVNTAAIDNPDLISEGSEKFGSDCIVVAIDGGKNGRMESGYECYTHGGKKPTGIDVVEWAREMESRGAGRILPTSLDRDGTKEGYDIEFTNAISEAVDVPVIASGGCGNPDHILEVFQKTKAAGALAASIFHYNEYSIGDVKRFLKENGISVRL